MSFFGINIKKIREIKNLTQEAFAELFDLKRATLGAYEEGRSEPKIETLIRIAKKFSVPVDLLLTKELSITDLLSFKDDLLVNPRTLEIELLAYVPLIRPEDRPEMIRSKMGKTFLSHLPQLRLPLPAESSYLAWFISDLEMSNDLEGFLPGNIVILEKSEKELIPENGQEILGLILTEDRSFFRRIKTHKGEILLRAGHPLLPSNTLTINEIREFWRVISVITNTLPTYRKSTQDRLQFIEAELELLKDTDQR